MSDETNPVRIDEHLAVDAVEKHQLEALEGLQQAVEAVVVIGALGCQVSGYISNRHYRVMAREENCVI